MEYSAKAVVVKEFGGYDSLSVQKFPLAPLEQNVEVKVHFCGMNFADLYTRQGLMAGQKLPIVLGLECAGVVTAIGCKDKTSLKVGQRVVCYDYKGGMYQDVIRVSPEKCYPLPDHASLEEGAAIFVNYLTAYYCIFELGNLKPSQNILVQSCAGGVGWAATQLAKTVEGVKVYGTASKSKEDAVKTNGVDHVLEYENLESQLKKLSPEGLDLIIDNQSGKIFNSLQDCLKPLGRIVLIGANNMIKNEKKLSPFTLLKSWWTTKGVSPAALIVHNRMVGGFHLGTLCEKEQMKVRATLSRLFIMLQNNKILPKIDSTWPVDSIVNATKVLAERRNIGKVLIAMDG